jgi:FKBP-type peptidyl-prolyl cis-trans isomerase 2
MLIPGFEEALIGMKVGEVKKTTIIAEEAYGPHREEMTAKVERSNLPPDLNPQIGEQLQMQRPDGQVMVVTVIASDEATITIDANHPMAGKDLTFELELIEIG